jgi:hypothetical protein
MATTVLVDADGLLYLAGAVGETRSYYAIFEGADGDIFGVHKDSAAEVKEFAAARPDLTLLERELIVRPGPVEHCLAIAKRKLRDIRLRYRHLDHMRMEIYLKGDGTNFRDDIATIHGYKENRTAVKPHWLDEIKDYLITYHDAIEVSGKEADDQIATRAYEMSGQYVIASPDKDLDQIHGVHWNYAKNVQYHVSPEEAEEFFWQQILTGDYADNIHGCWQCGETKAWKILRENWDPIEDRWHAVVRAYEDSQQLVRGDKTCPYADMDPEEVALENARLVWMQTEPRRLWTPPGWPHEYLEATLDD